MREFKAALLAREVAQIGEMTTAWLKVERAVTGSINDLVSVIDALIKAGEMPSRGQLLRLKQLWDLLEQIRIASNVFAVDFLTPFITAGQAESVNLGIAHAIEIIQLAFTSEAQFAAVFNRLNVAAVEYMIGLTGAGQPLWELIKRRVITGPDVIQRVIDTLIEGIARGYNPRKIARMIANDLAGGLNKALQIARTEQLRVYRESSLLQYLESGVVREYKRLSARDKRVCPACLMADGKVYKIEVPFAEHPQGRCVPVPVVIGVSEPMWETGMDWFKRQDPQIQVLILGPGRYEAWVAGFYELEDLITETTHEIWGCFDPNPIE